MHHRRQGRAWLRDGQAHHKAGAGEGLGVTKGLRGRGACLLRVWEECCPAKRCRAHHQAGKGKGLEVLQS